MKPKHGCKNPATATYCPTRESHNLLNTSHHSKSVMRRLLSESVLIRPHLFGTRADRKSQVRQCLGFCTAAIWSSLAYESAEQKPKHCLTPGFLIPPIIHLLLLSLSQPLSRDVADRRLSAAVAPVPRARRRRRPPDRRLLRVRAGRAAAQVPPLPGTNSIKIGLPGKWILGDYFQENMTSRRPFHTSREGDAGWILVANQNSSRIC